MGGLDALSHDGCGGILGGGVLFFRLGLVGGEATPFGRTGDLVRDRGVLAGGLGVDVALDGVGVALGVQQACRRCTSGRAEA